MASEKTGYACELVALAACKMAACSRNFVADFQSKELGLTNASPDIVLRCKKTNTIEAVIQVTFAGSKPDSQKKFWRNLGEAQEIKRRLGSDVVVTAVTFGSAYLNYIPAVYREGWDGAVFADAISTRLLHLAKCLSAQELDSLHEKMEWLAAQASSQTHLRMLSDAIHQSVASGGSSTLWTLHANQSNSESARGMKTTAVRRGFAFLTLGKHPKGLISTPIKLPHPTCAALCDIGVLKKVVGGRYRLVQEEALSVIHEFGVKKVENVLMDVPWMRMNQWIDYALESASVVAEAERWAQRWSKMCPQGLFQRLCSAALSVPPHSEVFIALFELIRAVLDRRQGLGAEQLLRAIEGQELKPGSFSEYKRLLGRKAVLRDHETIRLGLQSVFSPGGKQGFSLTKDDLVRVSLAIFTDYVNQMDVSAVNSAVSDVKNHVFDTYFDIKIVTYRHFDPIGSLIRVCLKEAGFAYSIESIGSGFAEAAKAMGALIDPRATNTQVIRAKHSLINWQSANDSHTYDKRNELCGRAVALRYSWNRTENRYVPRQGVQKLILIIDGNWKQGDLNSLMYAGWDEILYPDEMDKLATAIV